jgi:hypothetical protein
VVFGLGGKEDNTSTPINTEKPTSEELDEIKKIADRLDSDEQVIVVAKQSRFKPGGSLVTTPNIIFATNKRLILRNPTMLGLRENVEDYSYDKITNIKLEKGMFSSTLVITAPGMGTASRASNLTGVIAWGRKEDGMIDAIPKDKAEQILRVVRNGMEEARKAKMYPSVTVQQTTSIADELTKLVKLKEQGILTDEEFTKMKQDLINKK